MAVALVAYIVFFSVRLARGVTRSSSEAASIVRLQVLNGTGMRGMASWMTERISGYSDRDLEIKVVDTGNFDLTEVTGSFVISRDQDLELARLLAGRLGLDPAGVVYKPLSNNHQLATATLVLGRDYSRITLNTQASKEK